MEPDYEKYRPFVEELDLSDEKKDELIFTVWSMMKYFVDASFGDDPVQLSSLEVCLRTGKSVLDRVNSTQTDKDQSDNEEPMP